jgi:hypothetical protein
LQMKGHFVFLASINASLGFPETPVSKEIKWKPNRGFQVLVTQYWMNWRGMLKCTLCWNIIGIIFMFCSLFIYVYIYICMLYISSFTSLLQFGWIRMHTGKKQIHWVLLFSW